MEMIPSVSVAAAANLPPKTERNAMRLLALAHPDNGHITTTWTALCTLWGCSEAVVRRHLGYMRREGLIHYSSNQEDVYINFYAWSALLEMKIVHKMDEKRAWAREDDSADDDETDPDNPPDDEKRAWAREDDDETDPDNPPDDENRPQNGRKTRVGARKTRVGPTIGGENRGGERERDLIPLPEKNSLTHSLPDAEQKMSVAILTDAAVGLSSFSAKRLATKYPFEDIRAFACRWADEGRKPTDEAGLIAYRLDAAETVPPLSHNELWQRHRTPAEIADDDQRQTAAAEENRRWEERQRALAAVPVASAQGNVEPADIWQMALDDLALSLPAPTYESWLRDTNFLSCTDGQFVIGVPNAQARDWLTYRLMPRVESILSRLAKRASKVSFSVRQRPNPNGDHPH